MAMSTVPFDQLTTVLTTSARTRFFMGFKYVRDLMSKLATGSKDIKDIISNIFKNFAHAEKELTQSIESLSNNCLDEEAELSRKQSNLQKLKISLASLDASLQEKEKCLVKQEESVKYARKEVDKSERRVERAEEKLDDAKSTQKYALRAAAGAAFIPFVNVVATPALLVASCTALESAVSNAKSSLRCERSTLSDAESTYEAMGEARDKLLEDRMQMKNKISSLESMMAHQNRTIRDYKDKISEKNRILTELRKCTKTISKVSGRAEVLSGATMKMYDISLLYNPLRSLVESLKAVPQTFCSTRSISEPTFWEAVLSSDTFSEVTELSEW